MKPFDWNNEKNILLKAQRGVSFDDAAKAILSKDLLDSILHTNQKKYPGQKIFIVLIQGYCYKVAYVENKDNIYLKTLFPSRKDMKKYLNKKGESYEQNN